MVQADAACELLSVVVQAVAPAALRSSSLAC
jgi:hypothetical protein